MHEKKIEVVVRRVEEIDKLTWLYKQHQMMSPLEHEKHTPLRNGIKQKLAARDRWQLPQTSRA
jgi:hypothetical protein